MKKRLSKLLFFTIGGLLTLSGSLHAQLVLNQPNTTGVFTAPQSITLLPGFSTNGDFHAKIQSAPKPPIIQNLSQNQNYIVDNTIKVPGITNTSQLQGLSADELQQTVSYYDGLGRKMQVVQTQGSPSLKDIVTPTIYDNFGREVFKYLPFVAINTTGDGSFKSGNPDALVKGFYNPLSPGAMDVATTLYPFGETQFENSPLNRVVKQGAPGDAWQLSQGHTINTIRSSNVQNEVRIWKITATGCDGSTFYLPNRLFKTITTDENGSENIEFKDLDGHIVLKQVQADNGLLNTYFIYDDFGNLKYVIPPLPQEVTFPSSFVESDAVFKNFIFAYDHDGRHRLTERKIPGKEWEYFVYNKIDQLVMTQDGNQRSKAPQEWTITKYDGLSRIVVTAIYIHQESAPNTSFRSYMQDQVDNQTTQSEIRDNSVLGYSSITYPSTWNTTLTVNYYDDYTFLPVGNNYSSTTSGVSSRTKSLLTGTKINILNTSNMLLVANYYDEQGRLRESVGDNHLSGKDRVVNTYNFIGQVITSLREHQTSTGKVTIQNDYVYDHAGRKRLIKEKITGADGITTSPIVIARYDYNEIGQLVKKYLHSEDYSNIDIPDVSSFLYSIAYSYNARGWSKSINSKEFTMSLEYESSNQRFNGDITSASWGTESNPSQNTFTYTYDRMNRLLA